ncbi:MAG: T9SS type A sorting domain-containing protein, partial [Bacteroidales bacterium]|nr:T9SS type A sorting domain-containing protein [Bacteroidales bacterium]
IMANTTSISNLNYVESYGPSFDQAFAVAGENLSGDLVITAPTDYEISLTGAENFSAETPISLAQSNGIVQSEIIYVRLKAGLVKNSYTGNISLSSTGASDVTIALSGEVSDQPGLPYTQNFENFTSIAYLPDAWHVTDTKYEGDWGSGTSEGMRGKQNVLGYQNISTSNFTATLTLKNNSENLIDELFIIYEGKVERNTQNRSPKWTVKVDEIEVPSLSYSTELNSDTYHSAYISGLNITPGSNYSISWSTSTGEGSGSNKQIGISNVSVLGRADITELNAGNVGSINGETNSFVNSDYTLEVDLVFKNLFILGTAKLNVSANFNLTLNGTLYVGQNASLTLKSDINNTASLIVNGSANGNITAERHIAAASDWESANDGWHLLSSPVAAQAISGDWTPDGSSSNDYDFYAWSEPGQEYLNQKLAGNNIDNFIPGTGYYVSYQQTSIPEFIGIPNTSNEDVTLTLSGTPAINNSYGYILLGNPYPSALDWSHTSWVKTNVEGVAKIWNNGGFVDIDDDPTVIPAMNGFFVKTIANNNTFTIPAAARIHNSQNWYKSKSNKTIKLIAKEVNGKLQQESRIKFNPAASDGFDLEYDGSFMTGYAPMFYSTDGEHLYSTNTLPALYSELEIPFTFVKNNKEAFEIELAQSIDGLIVYLTDFKTNTQHNLSQNPSYSFTASTSDAPDRFLLHFGAVGIGEQDQAATLNAYTYNNRLYVNNSLEKAQLAIYDLQGRLVAQQVINESGLQSLPLNLPAGIYVMQLSNAQEAQSVKINVQ